MLTNTRTQITAGTALTLLALFLLLLLPAGLPRLFITILLISLLPGWLLINGVFSWAGHSISFIEQIVLGTATSYGLTIIGGLGVYYALGRMSQTAMLILYAGAALVGSILAFTSNRTTAKQPSLSSRPPWLLLGILALSAGFSFYFQSYSDLRGDEAEVAFRALATIQQQGAPILSHTKAPAETLIAAATGALFGGFNELSLRLPFGLAAWLTVLGTYLLGQQLFGTRVALMGAALLAINGWLVSHGRAAQYQTVLLMFSNVAIYSYYRFYQTRETLYLWIGAIVMSGALLCHYDGLSVVLPALFLLGLSLKQTGANHKKSLLSIAGSLLMAGLILLMFYIPFLLTANNVQQDHFIKNFGTEQPYNNWAEFYINGLYYNAIYYVLGLGAVLLGGTLLGFRQTISRAPRPGFLTLLALPLLLLSWPGLLPNWYAVVIFLALVSLFLLSTSVNRAVKVLLLWLVFPFILYQFLIIRPGNHYYVLMPALVLLAGLTLNYSLRWLAHPNRAVLRRRVLPAVAGILLVLYGLSAWYEYLVFLRTDQEYMLTYPQHRQSVFWSDPRYPFNIRIGWGFPYRLGWQTVSEMYRTGKLSGDWYGNDENNSIAWYTLNQPRNPCYPYNFMLTEIGYEDPPLDVPQDIINQHYDLRAIINVNDQPRLRLYQFAPLGQQIEPTIYNEPAAASTPYRAGMLPHNLIANTPQTEPTTPLQPPRQFKPHPDMLAQLVDIYGDPRLVEIKGKVSLLGYDLDDTWAVPGGVILLTLYWQANDPVILPYKVFAHLDNGQLLAQADNEPGCDQYPTYNWQTGEQIIDRHAIFLPDDLYPGDYPLQVGLYEKRSTLRMDLLDELGNPVNTYLELPPVTIKPDQNQ